MGGCSEKGPEDSACSIRDRGQALNASPMGVNASRYQDLSYDRQPSRTIGELRRGVWGEPMARLPGAGPGGRRSSTGQTGINESTPCEKSHEHRGIRTRSAKGLMPESPLCV